MKQIKQDDLEFKKRMGEGYQSQMLNQKTKEEVQKRRTLETETQRLVEARRQLEAERLHNAETRRKAQVEVEDDMHTKMEMASFQKELGKLQREEYKRMIQDNAEKELEREKQYKQIFENIDKRLTVRQKVHEETVLCPQREKQRQFVDWVKRREDAYSKEMKERDEQLQERKKLVLRVRANIG